MVLSISTQKILWNKSHTKVQSDFYGTITNKAHTVVESDFCKKILHNESQTKIKVIVQEIRVKDWENSKDYLTLGLTGREASSTFSGFSWPLSILFSKTRDESFVDVGELGDVWDLGDVSAVDGSGGVAITVPGDVVVEDVPGVVWDEGISAGHDSSIGS